MTLVHFGTHEKCCLLGSDTKAIEALAVLMTHVEESDDEE